MDPHAPLYWLLMIVIFISLMKLRTLVILPRKAGPRIHRKTYIKP